MYQDPVADAGEVALGETERERVNWPRQSRSATKTGTVLVIVMAVVGFGFTGLLTIVPAVSAGKSTVASMGPEGAAAAAVHHTAARPLADPMNARIGPNMAAKTGGGLSMQPGCSAAPCPMGIVDYGLTPASTTYTENPFVVESFLDVSALGIGTATGGGCLDPNAEAGVCFTVQQNAVLHHTYVENTIGSYWTQNVPELAYDASCSSPCVSGTYSLTWLDNIWNFSYSGGICPSNTNAGQGCINPANIVGDYAGACSSFGGAPLFYYCVGPTVYDLLPPFTVWAWTDVDTFGPCVASASYACVNFYGGIIENGGFVYGAYYDGVSFWAGTHRASGAIYYIHDSLAPYGLPYDFEWVAGGPGGGSSNSVLLLGDMQSYQAPARSASPLKEIKHAWSSGSDTAETISDLYMYNTAGDRPGMATTTFATDNPGIALW